MPVLRLFRRLIEEDDGGVIVTEAVLWVSIVVLSLTVGVAALRVSLAGFFQGEVEATAANSNQFAFDTGDLEYDVRTTQDFDTLFPMLGESAPSPSFE